MKIDFLRKKCPRFIYEKYFYKISGKNLEIFFDFRIEPNIIFRPKIIIENIDKKRLAKIENRVLNNLIFNLGLMEIPSYWKATCSPEIEIQAGYLGKEQIKWWKDLIVNGMGQFFYENKIDWREPNFLIIKNSLNNRKTNLPRPSLGRLGGRGTLAPVGGGKDSVVTLEILKKAKKELSSFSLNPTEAAKKIMKIAGCAKPIIVKREIDPKLLELNRRGFLNGHTPFSAYLAFLSTLVAVLFGKKYISVSNERSSNEGNVRYLGKAINHQWSKSSDFEQKFRKYSRKYLTSGVEYFSLLRPLYEIQIAKIFSQYPQSFSAFLSCNEAYKTGSGTKKPTQKWCGSCPKCLFVFTALYPFIKESELLKIFRKNLFADKSLLPVMQQLTERAFKPFECVGTKKETLIAFYLAYQKCIGDTYAKLPVLLKYFKEKIIPQYPNLEKESQRVLNSWNSQNNLPKEFEKALKKVVF